MASAAARAATYPFVSIMPIALFAICLLPFILPSLNHEDIPWFFVDVRFLTFLSPTSLADFGLLATPASLLLCCHQSTQ
jgi:hypothetical protein